MSTTEITDKCGHGDTKYFTCGPPSKN